MKQGGERLQGQQTPHPYQAERRSLDVAAFHGNHLLHAAMSAALDAGLEATALHNHFFFDQPKIYFMHIGGMGNTTRMGRGVRAVYDRIAQVRSGQATPANAFPGDIPATSSISAAPIEDVFAMKSQTSNGMVKVVTAARRRCRGSRSATR
jgi:hypothetical protein